MSPTKKRTHEQQIIRKKKSFEKEPKKRRTSYLNNHLLVFPINNKFRVTSKKVPQDCFICTLQYLSILDELYADMLRTFIIGRGASIEQMLAVLRVVLKDDYKKIETETLPFDSIYQLFDLLTPSSATIVGFMFPNSSGHIVLLAKDENSKIGIIDPQSDVMCVQEECDEYIKPYRNQPFLIFTHE